MTFPGPLPIPNSLRASTSAGQLSGGWDRSSQVPAAYSSTRRRPRRAAAGGRGDGSAVAQPSAGRAPQLAVVVGPEFGNPPAPVAELVQRVRHKAKLTSL